MAHRSRPLRTGACTVAALVVLATVAVAQPAAAAAPTRTVSTVAELTAELTSPAASTETIVLDADLTSAPSTAVRSKASSVLTVDLAGHSAALGYLELGTGAALRITDSTSAGGTLTVDGAAVDTPIRVPFGTTFTVDGTARLRATGGRSSAVIGSHAAPDTYGAGEIDFLGHAVVDVRGSSSGGRTSSGVGGPWTSIHIGEHAVVSVLATSSGAALGGGSGGTTGDSAVLIDGDAVVTATTTGLGGAAIGSAAGIGSNRLTAVTVTDRAVVTATGGAYGPGIGNGGTSSTSTTLTVGGTAVVTARGGTSSAGIGGGVGTTAGGNGAAVTIGAGASVTAAGGSASDTAIGSGTGRAAASSGSLTNAGRLTIPAGAALRIPAGATVVNSGTITTSGPVGGAGSIANSGTIATLGAGGSLDPATPISGDRTAIDFDPGAGSPTGPTSLRLTADSIRAGGTSAPLPAPPAGRVVLGWNTRTDGSGEYVDDTTDLRTVAAPSSSGAAHLTLHAVLLATADAVPRLPVDDPAEATAGSASTGTFGVVGGAEPVAYRVSAGALPTGLALDAATGAVTGVAGQPQTARVTVEATNRFGADTHQYLVRITAPPAVAAPVSPPAAAPIPDETTPPTATPAAPPTPRPAASATAPVAVPLPQLPAALARTRLPVGAPVEQALGSPGSAVAVTAGSLPAGLRLVQARAAVSGTPTRPGRYRFTLTAMTAAGSVARTYSLVVVAPLSVAVARPTGARVLPLAAGSGTTVVLRGLLPGERYAVRWAGRVVAQGTARAALTSLRVRVPQRAGLRVLGVRAADHQGPGASRAVAVLPVGDVLAVTAPDGVQANRVLTIRVHGLAPGEPVRVRYGSRTVTPGDARADGEGVYRVRTSAGWSWGWKPIEVRGLTGRTGSARVAVLPRRD